MLMDGNKKKFSFFVFAPTGLRLSRKESHTISASECFEINVELFVPFNAIIILPFQKHKKKVLS